MIITKHKLIHPSNTLSSINVPLYCQVITKTCGVWLLLCCILYVYVDPCWSWLSVFYLGVVGPMCCGATMVRIWIPQATVLLDIVYLVCLVDYQINTWLAVLLPLEQVIQFANYLSSPKYFLDQIIICRIDRGSSFCPIQSYFHVWHTPSRRAMQFLLKLWGIWAAMALQLEMRDPGRINGILNSGVDIIFVNLD